MACETAWAISSGTFVSFEPHLAILCNQFRIEKALEFGPGKSTRMLLELTNAKIRSIETSKEWYERYKSSFDPMRVKYLHQAAEQPIATLIDGDADFDLVFIDGGDRVAALHASRDLLSPDGFAYLHDAHREEYEPGIAAYSARFFPERHSCVLAQNPDVIDRIRACLTTDYSCRCKYCSPSERRAYFSRMAGLPNA